MNQKARIVDPGLCISRSLRLRPSLVSVAMADYVKSMRTLLLATVFSLAGASGAGAFCMSSPDTAATHNVENNTAQALCLQQELAREAAFSAEQARIDALIANMRLDAERQQQMLYDQLNQALFPAPVY